MLKQLNELCEKLDTVMEKHLHRQIVLYGYDSYSGRFIRWYAKYYHNIEVDYLVEDTY